MNGQLIVTTFGMFDDGMLSNATSTRHIHGSWFSSMADVEAMIEEERERPDFCSAEWESWD